VLRLVSAGEDLGGADSDMLVQGKADQCAPAVGMARWSIHGADGASAENLLDRLGRLVLDRLGLGY
jgi:hypothetical protein